MKIDYEQLLKLRLHKNSKHPAQTEWTDPKKLHKKIDLKHNNVGIATGGVNNIIVIDVDDKCNPAKGISDGIAEWKKYTDQYGEPQTVKQRTINNGFHYIFKYHTEQKKSSETVKQKTKPTGGKTNPFIFNAEKIDSKNIIENELKNDKKPFEYVDPNKQFLIDNYLKNSSKFRKSSIDIRSNGGYIVAAPSTINGKSYEFINSFEDTEIIEMPNELVNWLLGNNIFTSESEHKKVDKLKAKISKAKIIEPIKPEPKLPQIKKISSKIVWEITDKLLSEYLHQLPAKHASDKNLWLPILSVCKSLDKYDVFNNWSKTSKANYDERRNIEIWNANDAIINVNYLVNILNNLGHKLPLVRFYKTFKKFSKKHNIRTINYHQNFVYDENTSEEQFTYDYFKNNETIILESGTGTGKTTAVAQHTRRYLDENQNLKLMTVTDLINLSNQHVNSFAKEDIKLESYQNKEIDISESHATICINSLLKLEHKPSYFFKNYIIYADEINTILNYTHNKTIIDFKKVNSILLRIINNAHKVIVSDATIDDNVLYFLNERPEATSLILINTYKKYKGKQAIRMLNENEFNNQIKKNISVNDYFLFGSDSATIATKKHNMCFKTSGINEREKMILITADSGFEYSDAKTQFTDKFIFHSPKITHSIDFSIDTPQDVFIHIKGKTIDSMALFQQISRTRNIRNLYYYSDVECFEPKFESLEAVKEYYSQIEHATSQINDVCVITGENDIDRVCDNKFLNLYCATDYKKDCYRTNKIKHFELILINAGFILSSIGTAQKISKEEDSEMTEQLKLNKDELFEQYLITDNKFQPKFKCIFDNITALGMNDISLDVLPTYKKILIDKFEVDKNYNFDSLQKTTDYINEKIVEIEKRDHIMRCYNSSYHKIIQMRTLLKKYQIEDQYNFEYGNDKQLDVLLDDGFYNLIKQTFRTEKPKPQNLQEVLKLHVMMLKNITSPDIINSVTKQIKGSRKSRFSLNMDYIKTQINIIKIRNPKFRNYKDVHLKRFNIEDHETADNDDIFTDEP